AVVAAPRDDASVRELLHVGGEDARIADADAGLGFFPARRPDVDPQVGDLGDLVPLLWLHQMNRLLADDAEHGTIPAQERDPLAHEHLRIPTADAGEIAVAVIVDMRDLHADFVDVPSEHEARLTLWVDRRDGVAAHIALDLVGERLHFVPPKAGWSRFESGRTRGIEEALQETDGSLRH